MSSKNICNMYKLMSLGDISKEEILRMLTIKEPTFYKYLKLLKNAGFDVQKTKNLYHISGFLNSINLSSAECSMIAYLMFLAHVLLPVKKAEQLYRAFDKIIYLSNEETKKDVYEKLEKLKNAQNNNIYKEKMEIFEKYCDLNVFLEVILNSGKHLNLKPDKVIFKNKRIYFNFTDGSKAKKSININNIVKLKPKINKVEINKDTEEIIFELYGRLANAYLLKEGERVVDSINNKLIIANSTSDKKVLFRRLLRYDTFCKVKFPKKDADDFLKIVEKSLENIGHINDNI